MDRLYLRWYYLKRLRGFQLSANRVGWRSLENQQLRFQALTGIGDLNGQRVLDLGCGLGCLFAFLKGGGWAGEYTGMDVLEAMVREARRRFPGTRFEQRDILRSLPAEQWDYVLISGIFNHKVKDNRLWMDRLIRAAFSLARKGLAFNVLCSEGGWRDTDMFYADPRETEEKVSEWSHGKYRMVRGYLPEDMAFYLYKG